VINAGWYEPAAMQTGEYHFVTDSKNALFTDDERVPQQYLGSAICGTCIRKNFGFANITRARQSQLIC